MLTVLEMPPLKERLHRRHHPHVALVVDRVVAHRAGEHRRGARPTGAARRRSTSRRRCRRRCRRPAARRSRGGRRARGTVWLTIDIVPPPTSFFVLTRPRSGSMPVVSQSIMNEIVPVGARTVACELRTPCSSPSRTAASQASLGGTDDVRPARASMTLDAAGSRRGASAARAACAPRCRRIRRTGPSAPPCGRSWRRRGRSSAT